MLNRQTSPTRPSRGSSLMWFAYTIFFLIQPIFAPSRKLWLATGIFFCLFVVVFAVYTETENERVRRWMILATFILGLTSLPWNNGATTFFIYTAAFIPFQFPTARKALALFGVEVVALFAEWYVFRGSGPHLQIPFGNILFAVFMLLVIGGSNVFFAEQKRADFKLRAAQEENIALAALAERERIARDLHDVLGHTLSVIALKAELAGRLLAGSGSLTPAQTRAVAEIGEVENITRTALAEVREAIGGYRARGLRAEIEAARKTLDAAGVTLLLVDESSTTPGTPNLSAAEETVLSLALREAVTNIVRHARATTCTLRIRMEGGRHRLTVEDNGSHAAAREGNGLRGMRERVEALGGRLSLDCTSGTRLDIELPQADLQLHEPVHA